MEQHKMTTNRPYLLRAFYEWIVDNDCSPYVVINAMHLGVDVPERFIQDGQIILNISPEAVKELLLDNKSISFLTRFAGIETGIYAPIAAVQAIYAEENGQGISFAEEEEDEPPPAPERPPLSKPSGSAKKSPSKAKKPGPPHLHLVK